MELNLRPLGLTELLDRSIWIYRKNFLLFLLIAGLAQVPITAGQLLISLFVLPSDIYTSSNGLSVSMLVFYGGTLLLAILGGVAMVVQMAALSVAVSERYHGRATGLGQVYRRTVRRWDSLLVLLLVVGGANLAIFLLFFAPFFLIAFVDPALGSPTGGVLLACLTGLACVGFLPATLLFAFVDTRWAFCVPAVMLENLTAIAGLRRSWNLVSGSFWRVLGAGIVLILFVYALMTVPSWLLQFAVLMLMANSTAVATALSTVAGSLVAVLVIPIEFTVLTLLYYDVRMRKEGYDLALRAESMVPSVPWVGLEQGA